MKMREVDAIELPPGQTVELKPAAFHVMFMGLKAPLKESSKVSVTLKFEKAGELKVDMWVEQPKAWSSRLGRSPVDCLRCSTRSFVFRAPGVRARVTMKPVQL